MEVLTNAMMVILQYINISNQHVVHGKHTMLCINYINFFNCKGFTSKGITGS